MLSEMEFRKILSPRDEVYKTEVDGNYHLGNSVECLRCLSRTPNIYTDYERWNYSHTNFPNAGRHRDVKCDHRRYRNGSSSCACHSRAKSKSLLYLEYEHPPQQYTYSTAKSKVLKSSYLFNNNISNYNDYVSKFVPRNGLKKPVLNRWNSDDSTLHIKNKAICRHSEECSQHKLKEEKIGFSNSSETLYNIPDDTEIWKTRVRSSPNLHESIYKSSYIRPSQTSRRIQSHNEKMGPIYDYYSSIENENDIYDPSLPPIPLLDEEHSSLESTVLSQISESSVSNSSTGTQYGSSSPYRGVALTGLASVNPTLNEWYKSLEMTAKMGWTLILYLAIRSHYKPIAFAKLLFKGSREFVRATADYVTREPTLLSFRKGDIIKVTSTEAQYSSKGWLQGALDGRSGLFPIEYVTKIGRTEARLASKVDEIDSRLLTEKSSRENTKSPEEELSSSVTLNNGERGSPTAWNIPKSASPLDDSVHSSDEDGVINISEQIPKSNVDDGKHSLFQFALQHFRGAKESGIIDGSLQLAAQKAKKKKGSKEGVQWTWKDLVELVKFSQSPLKVSLLSLEGDLNSLAVETFTAIMRYTGDFPMDTEQTEVHCVYFILMNCHKHETLRDEVYCQIMKQTTNNKSSVPESCQRGWRLFSIIAAYFTCSDVLKPYLLKYLETNAYDKRRAFHGTAMVCLQNIRKTFRYGGRKNVPSIEEITAITAGRNSKRQIYRLPGGTERVINTKSTSIVQDILEELCSLINVRSAEEQEEFSLYCIVEGDTFTMPLAREEYVLDVTTELLKNKQIFYLVFCRSVYYYPLRLDNALYIEVVFNQIAPDYLAGFLLVTPGEHLNENVVYDIAKIAALMHRAADLDHIPTIKEVKYLLPRPLLKARDVKPPAWVSLVQGSWPEILPLSTMSAKATVLEILQNWPLFGSAFFDVQRITEPEEAHHTILALNKRGVHFLDPLTHETILTFPLDKIMSTRKVKGTDGDLYLDMKCGNLMKPRIITLKTNQAHEISRQIRQYITIEQRSNEHNQEDNPGDVTLTR